MTPKSGTPDWLRTTPLVCTRCELHRIPNSKAKNSTSTDCSTSGNLSLLEAPDDSKIRFNSALWGARNVHFNGHLLFWVSQRRGVMPDPDIRSRLFVVDRFRAVLLCG